MPSLPSRHEAVIKNDFRSCGSADTHFIFFLAHGNTFGISIYGKNSEAPDAAGFSCIGKESDFICNRCIGNEALGPIQYIAAVHLLSPAGNGAGVRTGPRFRKGKAAHAPFIQAVEIGLLLFIAACNEHRE